MNQQIAPFENPSVTSRGVLLIGHGTRDADGTEQFFLLANRLADSLQPIPVEPALLEFQQPTISAAWQSLVQRKVNHVHVAPLLLFAAGHAKDDIPGAIRQCVQETPEITWDQSRPLSRHRSIIDLVVDRIQSVLLRSAKQLDFVDRNPPLNRTALIMVGRGNRDPCAQADMRVLAEIVGHRTNIAATFTAFYAMAEPKFSDLLNQVANSDRFDNVIVHPHLLFAGRLHQAIAEQTERVASSFPSIDFQISHYLGPDQGVVQAIADRINAAV